MFISRAWFFCFIDRHVDNRKPNLCFVLKVPDKTSQNTKQDPLDKYLNRKSPELIYISVWRVMSPLALQFLFSYSTSWFPRKQPPDRRISESASEKLPNARPCLSCGLSQNNWSCSQGLGFLQASQCSQCRRLCKVRNVLNYVDKLWLKTV